MSARPVHRLLEGAARQEALAALAAAGWQVSADGRSIARGFAFPSFPAAFGWMVQVALLAERLDHHPAWTNVYRRVEVRLTTQSAGGLTGLDVEMARLR